MSKREDARRVVEQSDLMLDYLTAFVKRPESAEEHWEQLAGGREAARALASERFNSLRSEERLAVKWLLFDERRAMLEGLEWIPEAITELRRMAAQTVDSEDARAKERRKSFGTDGYIELATSLLDHPGSPAERNAAFRAECKKKNWQLPPDRTVRSYFQRAVKTRR
jgi:hypothetical protein